MVVGKPTFIFLRRNWHVSALRHFVWVRYITKINVRVPRIRASLRHGGARLFNIYSLKPPRGRPVGGVHRVRGYGGISPHFYIIPNTCVIAIILIFQPIVNDEEPMFHQDFFNTASSYPVNRATTASISTCFSNRSASTS